MQFYVQRQKNNSYHFGEVSLKSETYFTLRFKDLLLLVAHCCYIFPSELYTNGFDSRGFNTSHNKVHLRFILFLVELMRLWVENGNYWNLFDVT